MTQSGQGNEPQPPAAPPAHEGVVLPSAGLRHGGAQGTPHGWPSPEQAAPAEGQPWGDPWGPGATRPPQGPPPGVPAEPTGALVPREPVPGQALPPAAPAGYAPAPGQDSEATQLIPPVGGPIPGAEPRGGAGPLPGPMPGGPAPDGPAPGGALPLPPEGAASPRPQAPPAAGYGAAGLPLPAAGQPSPALPPHQAQPAAQPPQPAAPAQYGYPQPDPAAGYGYPPPQSGQAPTHQPLPGQQPHPGQPGPAGPHPAQSGHRDAYQPGSYQQSAPQPHTQVLRAQPPAPGGEQGHTQILRPQPPAPAADQGHTQILRPQPPAPQSGQRQPQPELRRQPESPAESTTMLRRPVFSDGPPPTGAGEETQVLPGPIPGGPAGAPPQPGGAPYGVRPGAPGDRQPPAEFDGLFRADGAGEAPDSTQQLPLFDQGPGQPAPQGPYPPHGSYGHGPDQGSYGQEPPGAGGHAGDGGGRRRSRRGVVIGAVVAACAVAGLAAGAAMSMGGGDDKKDKGEKAENADKEVVASDSPPPSPSPAKTQDPAEPQAKSLDALLKDSNSSRASVIASVNNIKSCKALPKAASDLRAAARQRNALVTRLGQISVDKLPHHAELTQALTKAWRSSASADNHYAAWADQAGKKRGCHKGKAHNTSHTALGNRASGEASAAKQQAAKLWNPVARKYGLTEREASQL